MSKELIRLRNLCMAFDDELVLDNINLYINDSEFTVRSQRLRQDHDPADHRRLHNAHGRRCAVRWCEDQ